MNKESLPDESKKVFSLVKKYLEFIIEKKYNFLNAYIFGSYAKGTFNENSDIDIAIIFNKLSNRFDMKVETVQLHSHY